MNHKELNLAAQIFLEEVFADIEKNYIKINPDWEIDHICFRVKSDESYEVHKKFFNELGSLLIESIVGGRLISTYKLHRPIEFMKYKIEVLELPAPKSNKITIEGFEHLEFVCKEPFEDLEERFKHCNLDRKGLSKSINKDLEVCFGERNIKFHHQSLASVIEIEKKQLDTNHL